MTIEELIKKAALPKKEREVIAGELYFLAETGLLHKNGKGRFSLAGRQNIFTGKLEKNLKGFGFVTGLEAETGPAPQKDVFVAKSGLADAEHGDKVLVTIAKSKRDQRLSGRILAVLQRASDRLVGFFRAEKGRNLIFPEDCRCPFVIDIGKKIPKKLKEGDAVIAAVTRAGRSNYHQGKIKKVLGSPDLVDVQMQLTAEKFELPVKFSKAALTEAAGFTDKITRRGREDLRELLHITIDGEDAKDFDDAVCVTKTRKGFRLHVSIADVSHFVRPGTALDQDAYQRGTSVYFPGRVIPMLPERLSNDLCSLVPNADRLAFTAILDFDRQGHLVRKKFCKSVIKSHHRFTYQTVQQIAVDKNPELRRKHKPFLTPLKWAVELAGQLMARRIERGAIGFNLPEPDIRLDQNGRIVSIERGKRTFAHQLIEEFMLAANEAAASLLIETETKALFRIHERPAPEKIEEFSVFAKSMGLKLPQAEISPAWFAEILDKIKGTPQEYIFNSLLLRTMQQAKYSPENPGHFGLAAANYTHFTSPIRRYPDLLVHRALMQAVKKGKKTGRQDSGNMAEAGRLLSARERRAIEAERDIHERLKTAFMKKYVGDIFEAVISGVSDSALFLELISPMVSGSIGLAELADDYYIHDRKNYRLIGDTGKKTYQIGDLIMVRLVRVDQNLRRLNFVPAKINQAKHGGSD